MSDEDLELHRNNVDIESRTITAVGLAVMLVLVVAAVVIYAQLTASGPVDDNTWPQGVQIPPDKLTLVDAEQEDFDQLLLGSGGGAPKIAHLAPIVPVSSQQLWYSSTEGLSTHNGPLQEMSKCMARADCTQAKLEEIATRALSQVGVPATGEGHAGGSDAPGGPCQSEPHGDQQVAVGLLAIVLASVQECRDAAASMFHRYQDLLAQHATPLPQEQRALGQLYADFQLAKLNDSANPKDNAPRFLKEMDGIVSRLDSIPALAQGYAGLRDDTSRGLSMAEIRAEYMMAKARNAVRAVGAARLGAQLAHDKVFSDDVQLESPGTPMTRGRAQLQLVWCLLALRAGADAHLKPESAGGSETCLRTLSDRRTELPPSLACGVQVRLDLRNGIWNLQRCDTGSGADTKTSLGYMRSLARSPAIWHEALAQYEGSAIDRRDKLNKYLTAYAAQSGTLDAFTWLAHEHPDRLAGWLIMCLLPFVLAWYLVWAWRRHAAIVRVLSPPFNLD